MSCQCPAQELARHVAIFQAFAYSFLSRTGFGHLEGGNPGLDVLIDLVR